MGVVKLLVGFLGRALLSLIFIASAINKFMDWQGTLQYLNQAIINWIPLTVGYDYLQHGLEWGLGNTTLLLALAVICELIGGLLVFFGVWTRLGAFLLIMFLVPTTGLFHHFWDLQGPDRLMQTIMFMKNISMLGGLLIVLAYGKGCSCKTSKEHADKQD